MPSKKIASFLIIGGAIFFAIFLIQNSSKEKVALGETTKSEYQFTEQLAASINPENQNLTDTFAQTIVDNIKNKGLVKFNVLNTTLLGKNPLTAFPEINQTKLTITEDVFGQDQINYFKNLVAGIRAFSAISQRSLRSKASS